MDSEKHYGIYLLIDPLTKEVRYVGKSRWGSTVRLSTHLSLAKSGEQTPKACWLRSLLAQQKRPGIVWIDWSSSAGEILLIEQEWISYYRDLGARLTNEHCGRPRFTDEKLHRVQVIVSESQYRWLKQQANIGETVRTLIDREMGIAALSVRINPAA